MIKKFIGLFSISILNIMIFIIVVYTPNISCKVIVPKKKKKKKKKKNLGGGGNKEGGFRKSIVHMVLYSDFMSFVRGLLQRYRTALHCHLFFLSIEKTYLLKDNISCT